MSVSAFSADYEVIVQDIKTFSSLHEELKVLARQSVEPNVFYESWLLAAALDSLQSDNVLLVVVRHRTEGLTGLFPFSSERKFRGLPLRSLQSWRHPYCFLCTPLVSARHGRETLKALFHWVGSRAAPCKIIELDLVASDGPFWNLLIDELSTQEAWVYRVVRHDRAVFECNQTPGAGVSRKHLKEFRRLERRFREQGETTYRVMLEDEAVEPWVERFLALEMSGWKGRAHTAVASDARSRNFFMQTAVAAARCKQLQMLALELDGRPIAMKCNFIANNVAFAFKIAYDEHYAKFSPGVLLEFFNMQHLKERCPQISFMDSCALPQHFMINRLWSGRRAIATCLIANHGVAALMIRHWDRYRQMRDWVDKWRERAERPHA